MTIIPDSNRTFSLNGLFLRVLNKNKCNVTVWSNSEIKDFGSTVMTVEQLISIRQALNKIIIQMKFNENK